MPFVHFAIGLVKIELIEKAEVKPCLYHDVLLNNCSFSHIFF